MTGTTAQPSGQAPSQPASTAQGSSASTPDSTLLGADTAAADKPEGDSAQAAAASSTDQNADKGGAQAKTGEEAKGENADKGAQAKAPEKYEFKFDDGVVIDTAAVEAFTPVMREANLTQEQAQKLADVYAAQVQRQHAEFQSKLAEEDFAIEQTALVLAQQREKWAETLKNDTELGGKNFETNVQAMQKAIARFGSPALKTLLNATGLGNHPELARFCLKVGQAISEDNPNHGTAGGGSRKSNEEVFYGDASA